MSGAVSVEYNFKTIKYKYQPNTTLNQILNEVLVHHSLVDSSQSFGLFYRDKLLNLSFNFRMLNLPQGAKLFLKPIDYTKLSVRIKFQVSPQNTSKIVKLTPVDNVLQVLNNDLKIDREFNMQVFNKVYTDKDIDSSTNFLKLGVIEDMVIKITVVNMIESIDTQSVNPIVTIKEDEPQGVNTTQQTNSKNQLQENNSNETSTNDGNLHHPIAYKPAENPEKYMKEFANKDTDYEVDVEDAKKYQKMLNQRANPLLKKIELANSDVKKIKLNTDICHIRFRFPDRSILETTFQATESTHSLYAFINDNLRYENMEYRLHLPNPSIQIQDSLDLKLVSDLKLSSRTLIILDTKKPGPYFKASLIMKELVSNESTAAAAAAAAATQINTATSASKTGNENSIEKPMSPETPTSVKKSLEKKMSKFLRLSKK